MPTDTPVSDAANEAIAAAKVGDLLPFALFPEAPPRGSNRTFFWETIRQGDAQFRREADGYRRTE